MGRPNSPLPLEKIEPALAYLQRALDRGADAFTRGRRETQRSLTALCQRGLTLRRADFAAEANTWLESNVTAGGRRSMLVALRQRRAAERADGPRHVVRLTPEAHQAVRRLGKELNLSTGAVVARLAKVVLADRGLLDSLKGFTDT